MVKRLLITLLLVSLLAAGCGSGQVSTWLITSQHTDAKALVGYNIDGVEAGGIATWHPLDEVDWGPEPSGAGFYVGADTTWLLSATDEPDEALPPFSWLDGLSAVPYGRLEWIDSIDNGNFSNLEMRAVVGTRFLLDDSGRISVAVEYNEDDWESYVGLCFRF